MRKSFLCVLSAAALMLVTSSPLMADPPAKVANGVMLQGFGWNIQNGGTASKWYQLIEKRANEIKSMGYDFIWLPPASRSVSPQGYMPGDYYDLGNSNSPTFYGTEDELRSALKALNEAGVAPIADIVINHRCANEQDQNGLWNIYNYKKANWGKWAVCKGQFGGEGKADSGDTYAAAPDIDHTNEQVRNDIIDWMKWMKTVGFKAWRYDYVKGYDSKYNGMYDEATKPLFSVGEYWTSLSYSGSTPNYDQNGHRQQLCNWLDNNKSEVATTFDFTTKGILQEAVKGDYGRLKDKDGKPSGLIGWWPSRAVTFLDNHDTGSQQSHWPFPNNEVMQGYAYILTHPGIPCVFWEHVYDWNLGKEISKLIKVRKDNKINSGSKVEIVKAENGLYAALIDGGKVAMKLGSKDWDPGQGYTLAASGNKYAVWAKATKSASSSNVSRNSSSTKKTTAKKSTTTKKTTKKKTTTKK